jgi:hypothetical protein
VNISDLIVRYEPNVNAYEWASVVEVEEPINDPDTELPAIKIEIICRTPNEGGARFISEAFMDSLRNNGRRPDTGFYFDRVYLWEGNKIETRSIPGTGLRPASGRGPGFGRGPGLGPSTSATGEGTTDTMALANLDPEDVDPVTLEPITDDWRFVIWIDAIMEDYPDFDEGEEGEP